MASNNNWSQYPQQQQNPQQYPYQQQCNSNPIYNNYASQPPPPPPPPQYQGYAIMGNTFPGQHFQLDAAAVDTSCNQVYGIPPPPPPASASTPYGYSYQHNMNTPSIVPPPPPPPNSYLTSNNTHHSSNHLNINQTNLNAWHNNQDINRNNHFISKQLKNSQNRNKNTASSKPTPTTDKNTATSIFKCDICSKIENTPVTFPSSQALQNHMDAHVTCKHPNCNFIASKKLVSAHYSSKHGKFSGRGLKSITIQMPGSKKLQRFKICVGNHPDDIKSWIEERKKKFPTRKRILEKVEWREKGRMEGALGYGRKIGSNSRGATGSGGVSNKRGEFEDSAENKEAKRMKIESDVDNVISPMTKMVCNTNEKSNNNQNDKDEEQEGKHFANKDNSLTSLVAGYGSSDDDESSSNSNKDGNHGNGGATNRTNIGIDITRSKSDTNVSMKSQETTLMPQSMQPLPLPSQKSMKEDEVNYKNNNNEQIHEKSRMCRFFLRNGSCLNGEKCTYIHDVAAHESYIADREVKRKMQSQRDRARNEALREMDISPGRQGSSAGGSKNYRGIDSNGTKMPVGLGGQTLLSKLLENDMRRERSLTLQLLRYIVDCNYLQEKREMKEDTKENKEKDLDENVDVCNDGGASDTCNVVDRGAKNLIVE